MKSNEIIRGKLLSEDGTLALDVALKAMNIGAGDDVIVTSRTFLASASAIVTAMMATATTKQIAYPTNASVARPTVAPQLPPYTARNALSKCQFRPGTVDGKPEQSWARIQYQWRLE